jgi:hypothetical protein
MPSVHERRENANKKNKKKGEVGDAASKLSLNLTSDEISLTTSGFEHWILLVVSCSSFSCCSASPHEES